MGTKPWRGPGGLKSPRHNEGVEGAQAGEATLPLHLFPPPPHAVLADRLAGPRREGSDALPPLRVTKFGSARGGALAGDPLLSAVPCGQAVPPKSPPGPQPKLQQGLTLRVRGGGASGLWP